MTLFSVLIRKKMWGMPLEDVSPDILSRVPIRDDLNEFYFPDDKYQVLPKLGYTQFVSEVLKHPKISIELSCAFVHEMEDRFDYIFNSMPIDEYFDYSLGRLPYRSIRFHQYTVPFPKILPVATVNYTNASPYTRITEWKSFPNSSSNPWETTFTVEEPCNYEENDWEPYYPIKDLQGENLKLYSFYKNMVPSKMKFIGRCGTYSYIDMDDAIASALSICKEFLR